MPEDQQDGHRKHHEGEADVEPVCENAHLDVLRVPPDTLALEVHCVEGLVDPPLGRILHTGEARLREDGLEREEDPETVEVFMLRRTLYGLGRHCKTSRLFGLQEFANTCQGRGR